MFIGLGQQTSGNITATPLNGAVGPKTYQWEITQNNSGFFLLNATSQSCQLRRSSGQVGQTNTCKIRCRVTDAEGNPTFTNECTVTFAVVATQDTILVQSVVPSGTARASITFRPNGSLNSLVGQYLSDQPKTGAGNTLQVRCASVNQGAWDSQAAAVGTWVTINVDRVWFVETDVAAITKQCGATFQLRKSSGGTAFQFTVFAFADVEGPGGGF